MLFNSLINSNHKLYFYILTFHSMPTKVMQVYMARWICKTLPCPLIYVFIVFYLFFFFYGYYSLL